MYSVEIKFFWVYRLSLKPYIPPCVLESSAELFQSRILGITTTFLYISYPKKF